VITLDAVTVARIAGSSGDIVDWKFDTLQASSGDRETVSK
jgi:hypothetical protein